MKLSSRLPIHPPQCYSPSPDHGLDGRRGVSASRQPLQESTGNIQHPHPHAHHMAWYGQPWEALSSIPVSIPAPPVLRTQSLGPEYGAAAYARSQQQQQQQQHHHHHHHHHHRPDVHLQGRRRGHGTNPLMPLLTHAFQNYRKKQAEKTEQKWPDVLEAPFLDALLLIPKMGRQKYTIKQTLYGRNMLIGEYLWIAYCQSLPPGADPDPQMARGRKKVSSHIQVLRNFFDSHRWFHFFFNPRQDDKKKAKKRDATEGVSLKNNPVLIALSEGRFPDERPNYEYFAQILALNEQVQFRPKRCWIFVSHEDVVVGEDRTGHLPATGDRLGEAEYPHLARNLEREAWAKEEQQFFKGALLHEFTKELHQVESSSVRELSTEWESAFPDLHQRLKAITSTTTDAQCDILHMHATLELKEKRRFPSGSNLSSWVEINIEQPRLLNHRWRVETRLVRPPELGYSSEDSAPEVIYEPAKKEFTIPYQHRPGCDGRGHCDCLAQRCRRDGVAVPFPVPFPAEVWAQTLTNCAEYPAHPLSDSKRHERERERERGRKVKPEEDEEEGSRARRRAKSEDEEGEGVKARRRSKKFTQMDLVPKIAMMQEIFSCSPASPHEESSGNDSQRWTRRAVLLWTFETIHRLDSDGKLVAAQSGKTDWRFLTILDPASEYHQRQAVISGRKTSVDDYRETSSSLAGASRPASRDAIMSPSPTCQQHLSANMSENFSSPWVSASGLGSLSASAPQATYGGHLLPQTMPSHSTAAQAGYGLLDNFGSHGGLATPPPSASLASSFAHTFDTASTSSDILPSYMAAAGGLDTSSHSLGDTLSTVTDPFLAHVGVTYGKAQDGIRGWSSHAGGMDAGHSWSPAYPCVGMSATASWAGSQPQSASSRRGSEQNHHNHQHFNLHSQQHNHTHHSRLERQHPPWPPSITTTIGSTADEHDPWTPLTSAHTPGDASATATLPTTCADTSNGHHSTNNPTVSTAGRDTLLHDDSWTMHLPAPPPPPPSTTSATAAVTATATLAAVSPGNCWGDELPSMMPGTAVEGGCSPTPSTSSPTGAVAVGKQYHHHHHQQHSQHQYQQHGGYGVTMGMPLGLGPAGNVSFLPQQQQQRLEGKKRARADSDAVEDGHGHGHGGEDDGEGDVDGDVDGDGVEGRLPVAKRARADVVGMSLGMEGGYHHLRRGRS